MLFGIARLIVLILMASFIVRSPLRRGGTRVISDRQLAIMCAIMAGVLALGVFFQRFH